MGRAKPNKPRRERPEPPQDQTSGMWINSDVDPITGDYILTVSYEGDRIWSFTRDEGWLYAQMVATQLSRATHDAAVLRLFTERMGLPLESAAGLIASVRADRRPVDQIGPLEVTPGVNPALKPFLTLSFDGEPVGQWEVEDARSHLLGIMEAVETIELDDRLRRVMLHDVGVEDQVARAFVNDLADYRA